MTKAIPDTNHEPGRQSPLSFGGLVLAGGAGTRMGADKALVEVEGSALVEIAARALDEAGADPILVVGRARREFAHLGLLTIPDQWPNQGPLGGIITGLIALGVDENRPVDLAAVLACDLPRASHLAVRATMAAMGDADVTVPVVAGHRQYLHSGWNRRVLPRLQTAFDNGIRSIRATLDGFTVAEPGPEAGWQNHEVWFEDADYPEDLLRLSAGE